MELSTEKVKSQRLTRKTAHLFLTPKQKKLVETLLDNATKTGKRLTFGQAMIQAGYSQASSTQPSRIVQTPAVQLALQNTIAMMKSKRDELVASITAEKIKKTSVRDAVYSADLLTKNHRLLEEKSTDNLATAPQLVVFGSDRLTDLLQHNKSELSNTLDTP